MRAARAAVCALLCAGLFAAVPAAGDTPPSLWDKDPMARSRYDLHARVRDALAQIGDDTSEERKSLLLARLVAYLKEGGAETSPDVRLRYDLGDVYERMHRHEDAARVLRPAVDENPDHSATPDALAQLAYAYAYLNRPKDEREIYHRYIPRVRDQGSKLVALLNLAEAEMHLGNLTEAVAGYREAVSLGNALAMDFGSYGVVTTTILSRWGLVVALDRAGEPDEAEAELRVVARADSDEKIIGDTQTVFFVPRYERCWYLAMSATHHARHAGSRAEALASWRRAEAEWNEYVNEASTGDRYVALARAHLARTRQILRRVEREASQEHPREP